MQALLSRSQPGGTRRVVYRADYPRPVPGPGEALLRVTRAGICATDLELLRGYRDFDGVLGHEFCGVVEQSHDPAWQGGRAVAEINVACGTCRECRTIARSHCSRRAAIGIFGHDGAFADYVAVPLENLHALPAEVTDDMGVFVEPLAAACSVPDLVHIAPAMRVSVLGAGRLGLLVAQVLALSGCDLRVIARHAAQLELLRAWEISGQLAPATWPGDLAKLEHTQDVVVECSGSPEAFAQAQALLRPRGTLVLKSTYAGPAQVDLSRVAVDELRVLGSRCGPFEPAIRLLASGRVNVTALIHARFPLREGAAAFERAAQPGVLKVLLEP